MHTSDSENAPDWGGRLLSLTKLPVIVDAEVFEAGRGAEVWQAGGEFFPL